MTEKREGVMADLMSIRASLLELLVVAILLALSVNLISSSLADLLSLPSLRTLVLGVAIGLIAVLYSVLRLVGQQHKLHSFEGFFVYNKTNNRLVSVPRYRYSDDLSRYLESAFSENQALLAMWDKEPLKDRWKFQDGKASPPKSFRSIDLIVEATEYFVLHELSLHLSDYFNKPKYSKNMLMRLQRNDIPDILLSNRFLELFSKPMEQRAQFMERSDTKPMEEWLQSMDRGDNPLHVEIVYAHGEGGALYDRFQMALPAKSELKRRDKNQIEIDTDRFRLILTTNFNGINTYIPSEFHQYVLRSGSYRDLIDFQVDVEIDVFFKLGAFLSRTGWDYYFWVDSFLDTFRRSFQRDAFFEMIGWERSLTILDFIEAQTHQPKTHEGN